MSPELRAELEAKHAQRLASKKPKKAKRKTKRKAKRKSKKAGCGIKTMKELTMRLALSKHGKPKVKAFRLK